jgi:hypothetical protein
VGDGRSVLVIHGYEYTVTICDDLVSVGCKIASLEKWKEGWAPESAPRLERDRDLLIALAEAHQAGAAK